MSGTFKSDASLQHDLISAPVQLASSGRKEFPIGMERPGCRRSLLWGKGLFDSQPRERECHGRHRCAESVGGGVFLLRNRLLDLTLSFSRGNLAGGCRGLVVAVDIRWFLFLVCERAETVPDGGPSPLIRPSLWRIRSSIYPIRPISGFGPW